MELGAFSVSLAVKDVEAPKDIEGLAALLRKAGFYSFPEEFNPEELGEWITSTEYEK